MKKYNIMYNIGKVKYLINYHDGISKHPDESPFYGIHTFQNKKKLLKKIGELKKEGYIYG